MSDAKYPDIAGFKEDETSREAAERIEERGRARRLREQVRHWYVDDGNEGTADECAHALGLSILAIRPRVTELNKSGVICKTGRRRCNYSGANAHVWRKAVLL